MSGAMEEPTVSKMWTMRRLTNKETGEVVTVTIEQTVEPTIAHPSRTDLFDLVVDDFDGDGMAVDWGDHVSVTIPNEAR
jgi:hypothetical protein